MARTLELAVRLIQALEDGGDAGNVEGYVVRLRIEAVGAPRRRRAAPLVVQSKGKDERHLTERGESLARG